MGFQDLSRMVQAQCSLTEGIDASPNLQDHMHLERMTLSRGEHMLDPHEALRDFDGLSQPGLVTLRAANGAGKTAFLSQCRQHFGDKSLFLPAAHKLDFGLPKGSTGQTVMRILAHIDAMQAKPKVILLDESDANLDANNTALARAMIDRWSATSCIIEVRNKD